MTNIPVETDDEDAHEQALRLPSSTRRYPSNGQTKGASQAQKSVPAIRRKSQLSSPSSPTPAFMHTRPAPRRRPHPLLLLGTGLLIMLLGWVLLSTVLAWWQVTQDDWHYGRPRTFQTDSAVGHHDSAAHPSHFLALNLNRYILIIELSGGDPSQAHLYTGPVLTGDRQDLAPVILSFRDVTGDGKPDMMIEVQGSRFVLVNDQGLFRPANAGEVKIS